MLWLTSSTSPSLTAHIRVTKGYPTLNTVHDFRASLVRSNTNAIMHRQARTGVAVRAANAVQEAPSPTTPVPVPHAELLAAFKTLQNGSDIRGVAVAGYEDQQLTLFPSFAFFIGKAFAEHLSDRLKLPCSALRVSLGRDPRISGPIMVAALLAGIASTGANATSFGISTTPAMFMSCVLPGWQYDGGIMVTASHLPYNRQGMKFCTEAGGLEKADISDILTRAANAAEQAGVATKPESYQDTGFVMGLCLQTDPSLIEQVDFLPSYAGYIQQVIREGVNHPEHYDTPLEGWKIVVNAGNGSAGFFVNQVLQPLGADTTGSLNLDPNGFFPAHIPNPEDKTAMAVTVNAVLRQQADLGIVFDTDVDRSGVVDADGTVINKNRYIALMAAITLRTYPGSTIVTCSTTSNGLTGFIQQLGGQHMRFKKGYRNVIGKGIQLNKQGVQTELMMETSGHGAMKENYFLDDGAYAVVKILIECVKRRLEGKGGIGELLGPLQEPAEAAEYRLKITSPEGVQAGKAVLEQFKAWVEGGAPGSEWKLEEVNYEGWRVAVQEGDGKSGWLLLRSSLHDPQMVLNVESEVQGGVRRILLNLERFMQQLPEGTLDAEPVLRAIASR